MMIREICFRTNSGKKIHTEEANNSGRSGEMWAGRQDLMVRGGGWGASKRRSSGGGGVDPCQLRCIATFLFPDAKYSRAAVISSKSFFSAK